MWVLNLSSVVSVPAGGENSSQASAGVCGVLGVQRPTADRSHHLRGHQKRYNYQNSPHSFWLDGTVLYSSGWFAKGLVRQEVTKQRCTAFQAPSHGPILWKSCMRRMEWTRSCWSTPWHSSIRWSCCGVYAIVYFFIPSILCCRAKLNPNHFTKYAFWLIQLPICRHLQPYQTRILSTTWWTVWRNRAWKQCLKDTWVGKALIWTWLSSSTSTRFEPQTTYLAVMWSQHLVIS